MQKTRHLLLLVIVAALLIIFWRPLWALAGLSLRRDQYSHIILIPLISIFLIYWRRTEVFARSASTCYAGLVPILFGLALFGVAGHINTNSLQEVGPSFSVSIMAFLISCVGAFLLIYGWSAFRDALFPLGFLLLMVPVPSVLLMKIIHALQQGSSEAAALILRAFGVPFFRDGLVFQLPGITIEVAEECSGIRSSIALLITTLLAARFTLRSNWRKLALCILVIPVAMLKNGLRIAALSALSVYVSHAFLFGRLHRSGGFVFFFLGLLVLWGVLRLLQVGDSRLGPKGSTPVPLGRAARKIEI
jgi:exosortase